MSRKMIWKIVLAGIAFLLVAVIVYSGLQILESTVFFTEEEEGPVASKTIERNGVKYFPRQDITVMMIVGIEHEGKIEEMDPKVGSMADMIMLLVFDEKDQSYTVLNLNRDTMTEIPQLNAIRGIQNGNFFGQLTYAYNYGTGREDSCESIKQTVSNLLGGIYIDHYLTMSLSAIEIMNDAVGGVTVRVEDDFSDLDSSIKMGEMTLMGRQARNFVQGRMIVGDGLNTSRMRRQQEYFSGFAKALKEKMEKDDTFIIKAYEKVSGYIVTDCSVNVLTSLAERYGDYTHRETVTPEGENKMGERYMEFHVDEGALDELVLRLFYAPKQ